MNSLGIGQDLAKAGSRRIVQGFQKKGFKSPRFKDYKKNSRMSFPARSVHQQNFPSLSRK
jgi:hypothetical protein